MPYQFFGSTLDPALAAAAMALACRARIAIGYLLLVVAGALTISHQVRSPERNSPLIPDVAWAFAFSLVFVAATSMARRTAQILDSTRRDAYRAAAQGADAQARADERNRFAAILTACWSVRRPGRRCRRLGCRGRRR